MPLDKKLVESIHHNIWTVGHAGSMKDKICSEEMFSTFLWWYETLLWRCRKVEPTLCLLCRTEGWKKVRMKRRMRDKIMVKWRKDVRTEGCTDACTVFRFFLSVQLQTQFSLQVSALSVLSLTKGNIFVFYVCTVLLFKKTVIILLFVILYIETDNCCSTLAGPGGNLHTIYISLLYFIWFTLS